MIPQYRGEVLKSIVTWYIQGYLETEKPTSIKALAQRMYETGLFKTRESNPVSTNTLEQEMGDVLKDLKALQYNGKQTENDTIKQHKN